MELPTPGHRRAPAAPRRRQRVLGVPDGALGHIDTLRPQRIEKGSV